MNPQVLGWRLAAARRTVGLTQAEVAARMGTTQSAVSRIEAGRSTPSIDVIERYARAIGQPITLTFGAEEKPITREQQRERVARALRGFRFDPWSRRPSAAEMKSLLKDDLTSGRD